MLEHRFQPDLSDGDKSKDDALALRVTIQTYNPEPPKQLAKTEEMQESISKAIQEYQNFKQAQFYHIYSPFQESCPSYVKNFQDRNLLIFWAMDLMTWFESGIVKYEHTFKYSESY